MTPVERRNFVSVVPVAKKSKLSPFSSQNILFIYKFSAQKQFTGRKMGKNPTKKGVFSRPSGQLTQFVRRCCATSTDKLSLSVDVAQHLRTNSASWPKGPKKHLFLEGFCPFFALFLASGPCIYMYICIYVHGRDILKRKGSYLSFFGRRDH